MDVQRGGLVRWDGSGRAAAICHAHQGGLGRLGRWWHVLRLSAIRLRLRDRRLHAVQLVLGIAEPVRAPNAVNTPAQPFEHLLAQTVAVAG